jgi:adenosylhomocysteine nucleosidase
MISTGLFFAVYDEAAAILKDPEYEWEKTDSVYRSKKYLLSLVISGIGKAFASFAVHPLIKDHERILIMGTSGGLSDEHVGDLYLLDGFIEYDMDATGLGFAPGITPFSGMKDPVITHRSAGYLKSVEAAASAAGYSLMRGRGISADRFVSDPVVSKRLELELNASLVDMESAAVAKLCWRNKREVLALRYVSDNANHNSAVDWNTNVARSSIVFNSILKEYLKGE